MEICMISFRSVMPAQRGERALRQAGIDSELSRTPKWLSQKGCGYSLRVSCERIRQAAELLRREEIPFRKIYRLQNGSKPEEWIL